MHMGIASHVRVKERYIHKYSPSKLMTRSQTTIITPILFAVFKVVACYERAGEDLNGS